MTLNLKMSTNDLWKGWPLTWYHHFTHIGCAKKLRGLRQKLDLYKMDSLFRIIRVSDEDSSVKKAFNFLNLFQIENFSAFSMHHSKPRHQLSTLSDFICYFSCIYIFFLAKWPWNWKPQQMNFETVESWHGMISSPT